MQTPREAARERQLFAAFVDGDDAAFHTLFTRYYERFVRDAQRYMSADAAEDLVQDVFASLWLNRTRWVVHTTVRSYLHGAVRNRARDLLARSNAEQRSAAALRRAMESARPSNPEDLLLLREVEQIIADGLASCAPRSRAALLLLGECPRYADIARRLGVRPGTVQVLIKRGRRRLRAYLRAHGWDDLTEISPVRRGAANRRIDTDLDLAG